MPYACCPISQEWEAYASRKVTGSPFNKDTILEDGAGQAAGIIGELAFGRLLKSNGINFQYVADKKHGHDFIAGGLKIDVKTKSCTSRPKPNYTAHVTNSQRDLDADVYVFARSSPDTVWICGWIYKEVFWDSDYATDLKQGQMADGMIQHADARRMQIQHLASITELLTALLRAQLAAT